MQYYLSLWHPLGASLILSLSFDPNVYHLPFHYLRFVLYDDLEFDSTGAFKSTRYRIDDF